MEDEDIESLAKKYYQHFVGKKWDECGAEVWLAPWRESYRRPTNVQHDVEAELKGAADPTTKRQAGMILDCVENPDAAREALSSAYDPPDVIDLRAYLIGDGEAMSGLLVAGRRQNGDTTLLVFLMD